MDRIDAPFVIDAAFLLILLLGSIGGLWRGVRREIYLSMGLLLGYALSVSWARPWANDLRDVWSISAGRAHFLVATAFVVIPALIVGLLGSRVAERTPPDFAGRVGGALLAIVNLVVAGTLIGQWARQDLLGPRREREVARTRVVDRLTDDLGLVLLASAAVAAAILLGGLVVQGRRRDQFRRATPLRAPDARVHRREQAVLAPEAEKVEPSPPSSIGGWVSRAVTRPTEAAATIPLPRIHETSQNGGAHAPLPPKGTSTAEWLTVTSADRRDEVVDRCLSCGERLTGSDRFCPRCGRSLV